MLAQAYCELGRLEDARAVFDPLMAVLADVPPDPNWILAVTRTASVCAHLGDRAAADRLHPLLTPYADRIAGNGVVWIGSVAHYLGLLATTLGHFDDAEAHFAAADAAHERLGAPGMAGPHPPGVGAPAPRRGEPEDADGPDILARSGHRPGTGSGQPGAAGRSALGERRGSG